MKWQQFYVQCRMHPGIMTKARARHFLLSNTWLWSHKPTKSLQWACRINHLINKKLQHTAKYTFRPGTHFLNEYSIRIYIFFSNSFCSDSNLASADLCQHIATIVAHDMYDTWDLCSQLRHVQNLFWWPENEIRQNEIFITLEMWITVTS